MQRFSNNGMMIIPTPPAPILTTQKTVIVTSCFCPIGHNLMSSRATFDGYAGVLIMVRKDAHEGLVALSPIFGNKHKIALEIDLISGDIMELLCPDCGTALPVYSHCHCGGDLIALFTNPNADFASCIGICNRVGCFNAEIKNFDDLLAQAMTESA